MKDFDKFLKEERKVNKPKIKPEHQTRKEILELARFQNCEIDVRAIFDKYDRILLNCKNDIERKHIAVMAIAELHNALNVTGELIVNGVELIPSSEEE